MHFLQATLCMISLQSELAPNKALKHVQRVALNWTPSTGAASHYRAGFSRRLALRYMPMRLNPRILLILASALINACSHSPDDNKLPSIEGRWICERSLEGEFDIKRENNFYRIYQVSEQSITSAPGEMTAQLSYDENSKKYIGQHIWGGKKQGPISWGDKNGMQITIINKDKF
jgi:hypothetical protein